MFFLTCMCITAHSSHYITDFFFGRKTSLRHEKFLPTNDFLTKLSAVYLRNAPLLHAYPIRTTVEVHHHQRNPFLFHYPPFSSPEICGNRSKHPSTCLGMNLTCVCVCMCTVCAPQSKVQVFLGVVQFHTWYVRGKSNYDIGSISFLSGTLLKFLFLIRELGVH